MQLITTTLLLVLLPFLGSVPKDKTSEAFGSIKIYGTSSLHDWEEVVTDYQITGLKKDQKIENLEVKVTAKSIKSDKSIMDDKTHDALKAHTFPTITMKAKQLVLNGGKVRGAGILTIAGKSKEVALEAAYSENDEKMLSVKGEVDLKMSEFGIEPPTAMFGTLTTGDEVSVIFDLRLSF